eukprot:scaffold1224_cov191-Pinguiococcus_pyrenoidosus.AAC.16
MQRPRRGSRTGDLDVHERIDRIAGAIGTASADFHRSRVDGVDKARLSARADCPCHKRVFGHDLEGVRAIYRSATKEVLGEDRERVRCSRLELLDRELQGARLIGEEVALQHFGRVAGAGEAEDDLQRSAAAVRRPRRIQDGAGAAPSHFLPEDHLDDWDHGVGRRADQCLGLLLVQRAVHRSTLLLTGLGPQDTNPQVHCVVEGHFRSRKEVHADLGTRVPAARFIRIVDRLKKSVTGKECLQLRVGLFDDGELEFDGHELAARREGGARQHNLAKVQTLPASWCET